MDQVVATPHAQESSAKFLQDCRGRICWRILLRGDIDETAALEHDCENMRTLAVPNYAT